MKQAALPSFIADGAQSQGQQFLRLQYGINIAGITLRITKGSIQQRFGNAGRHEIIERYRPGEDDPHLKVLQAAHISDDEYFSHMVLDDLSLIIRDIREAHKKDGESAPQTTVANELKENLEAVENFKGSRDEKLVVLYCKQLGINYKNLSEEEFRWFIRILKKSKKMGTPISQRKKR